MEACKAKFEKELRKNDCTKFSSNLANLFHPRGDEVFICLLKGLCKIAVGFV